MEFPCDDESTPMDHIPARSQVACVLQCGGIWIGGKGWGLTWKLFQCVVKKSAQSVALRGVCNVHLDPEDLEESSDKQQPKAAEQPKALDQPKATKPVSVAESAQVESDDEQEQEPEPEEVRPPAPVVVAEPEPEPEPVVEPEPAPVKKVVKKVVKKAA
jgi:hypothetical protein